MDAIHCNCNILAGQSVRETERHRVLLSMLLVDVVNIDVVNIDICCEDDELMSPPAPAPE